MESSEHLGLSRNLREEIGIQLLNVHKLTVKAELRMTWKKNTRDEGLQINFGSNRFNARES